MKTVAKTYDDGVRQSRTPSKRGRPTPHKLVVLAVDVVDAVNAAGGLIFDRVSAGWRVEVYLEALGDDRPLRILGVAARPLPVNLGEEPEWPDTVFVAADVHDRNTDVRRFIAAATRSHHTKVAIWEGNRPSEPNEGRDSVNHRPSNAARAFKVHAMGAAGSRPLVKATESFRNDGR